MTATRLLLCALAALAGCARPPLSGPPDTRLGRDECAECGMLVNEDRFSGAMLVDREGERLHVHFDDMGCMLEYQNDKGKSLTCLDAFARDHSTRQWVTADRAVYLFADDKALRTPMGSGIAAFAARDAAEKARAEFGGKILTLEELRTARREWMEARFGSPKAAEPGR
jgi:copper chaperone NosL